jgi:hypothetical protein
VSEPEKTKIIQIIEPELRFEITSELQLDGSSPRIKAEEVVE